MTPITEIRLACEADLAAMMAILNQEIASTVSCFRTEPLSSMEISEWWRAHPLESYPAWVAAVRSLSKSVGPDKIRGWASLSRWSSYEGYRRTAEVSIWIARDSRRRGIGSQLMQHLITNTPDPIRVLLSRIEAGNEGSVHLHERFGFKTVGTMHQVGEKFGKLLDVVIMEKQLGPPSDCGR